ncbi:MAG: RNA polymerase sigma factor [Candidatus Dormibacteria bacterium]
MPAPDPTPLHVVHDQARAADWESLYREHVADVYRHVYSRCGNRPDAEDVTSTVFLRALPRLRAGASHAELRAYLRATARTVLADLWRDRHGVDLDPDLIDALPNPASPDPTEVDVEPLLAGLPEHYRRVLELRFLRGYSLREAAAAMGATVANVKVMQMRALRRAAREHPR